MSILAWIGFSLLGITSGSLADETIGHSEPTVVSSLSAPAAPQGITFPNFTAKDFPFVTTLPDDGTDKGGGWQVAKVNLEFVRIIFPTNVLVWHCPFNIEMPLRTAEMGQIDAKRAAKLSAEITNRVALDMDYTLPQGIFCDRYFEGVKATFKSTYPKLGARPNK